METEIETNDELTIRIVGNYLDSKHERIKSYSELKMNLSSGVNFNKINYELAEKEYKRIRG